MTVPLSVGAFLAVALRLVVFVCGPSNVATQLLTANPSPTASTGTPAARATATARASATPSATPTSTAAALAMRGVVANSVVEFGSSQIGNVTPYHQISISAGNVPLNSSMVFDRSGNLRIGEGNLTINGNGNYSGQIIEYSAGQLAALASAPNPTPHATLTIPGAVYGLAIDASGNLWASVFVFSAQELVKFTVAQLAAGTGSPTPAITLTVQMQGAIAFASDWTRLAVRSH